MHVKYDKFELDNGLKVLFHEDKTTPIVAMNILYDVGARDENPDKTGFAHLFEHLMFGGSINIPNYDVPLEQAGGTNNAFTNNDITNYYLTIPLSNIETAFWLESDRMLSLAFSEKSLEVQRNVVVEEFRQRYLNQPYGDVWLLLRPLIYKEHPYQWPTIGKEISHIEQATMMDVKTFFQQYYCPNNAIMAIAGNLSLEEAKQLTEKWFGEIPSGPKNLRQLPKEPEQTEARVLEVNRKVPTDALYIAWNMCERNHKDYIPTDLLSDVLSRGDSSRLHEKLVKEKQLFISIDAYVMGSLDAGLFVIAGKLSDGVSMEKAEKAILEEVEKLKNELCEGQELEKVKNQVEATTVFSDLSPANRAMNLCYYELLGGADLVNTELEVYRQTTAEEIQKVAQHIFKETNRNTLRYYANK